MVKPSRKRLRVKPKKIKIPKSKKGTRNLKAESVIKEWQTDMEHQFMNEAKNKNVFKKIARKVRKWITKTEPVEPEEVEVKSMTLMSLLSWKNQEVSRTSREKTEITGNETVGEISEILWGVNIEIIQQLAGEISLADLAKSATVKQLPKVAVLIAKEVSFLMWSAYCAKSTEKLIPIVSNYVAKSFLPNGDQRLIQDLDSLIAECLAVIPKAGCKGDCAIDCVKPLVEKSGFFAYDVARNYAENGQPLSETLPMLKKVGITADNELILHIVKTATCVTYKMLTSQLNAREKKRIVIEFLVELSKFKNKKK